MNWLILIPLLAVAIACAAIPVLMDSGRRR